MVANSPKTGPRVEKKICGPRRWWGIVSRSMDRRLQNFKGPSSFWPGMHFRSRPSPVFPHCFPPRVPGAVMGCKNLQNLEVPRARKCAAPMYPNQVHAHVPNYVHDLVKNWDTKWSIIGTRDGQFCERRLVNHVNLGRFMFWPRPVGISWPIRFPIFNTFQL